MIGKIKVLKKENGYGFIIPHQNGKGVFSQGRDVFFHVSKLRNKDSFESMEEGQIVSFELGEGQRGQQALDVCVIEEGQDSEG